MKQVKYFLLARAIRIFLQFGFLFALIPFTFNLSKAIFNTKPYLKVGEYSIGKPFVGYQVKTTMSINIADTLNYLKNGGFFIGSKRPEVYGKVRSTFNGNEIQEQIVNNIRSEQEPTVKFSKISVNGDVFIDVLSKNKIQNFFWSCIVQINLIFIALFFLILIKLVNRYMDGEIFETRTFKLVSLLGILLITSEVLQIIVGYINQTILQYPQLETRSTITGRNFHVVDLNFNFAGAESYSNIGIGIFIILLSHVLNQAIIVKNENALTI